MRVRRTSSSSKSSKTSKAGKVGGSQFVNMVTKTAQVEDTEGVARQVRSALLDELMSLAEDLANGREGREETTKKFVSAVMRFRFKGLKGKGVKRAEETVADLINRDEALAQRLSTQLSRLAKS